MEENDVVTIFKQMARRVFNMQEEMYKRKRKYTMDQYCCSESEVEQMVSNFSTLMTEKDQVNYNFFLDLSTSEEEQDAD